MAIKHVKLFSIQYNAQIAETIIYVVTIITEDDKGENSKGK
jgi:hypothetical protein